jgi:hypothetical protein
VIQITSYLRSADGRFVPVGDACDAPPDPRYIEGAIDLSINGVTIMDTVLWDYVDQLWAYIVDMVISLREKGEASTFFPDQPIKLSFRRQNADNVLVKIEVNKIVKVATVSETELISTLRLHGLEFFDKLAKLLPRNAGRYEDAVMHLKGI